jgi:ubiquinone/menaquinone biosynthesis C-methylase UbiE
MTAAGPSIRFEDAAAYERYMGRWSQLVGDTFLEWLDPKQGLRWLDVGCGNGAFTEKLVERCAPELVRGIDPSEQQLVYARARAELQDGQFLKADAMALPFPDDSFDAAVMPLVIFFVPEPPRGVAEMARVVSPGGTVCAYAWDMEGGGFPYELVRAEMRALGLELPTPPSPDAASLKALTDLWTGAGLMAVQTRAITAQRTYGDFEDYWQCVLGGPSVGGKLAALPAETLARLRARLSEHLARDAAGRITCSAQANAVQGRVPIP